MPNNSTSQEQSILSTLTFFDIFSYPLTMFEIWKWLYINQQITNNSQQLLNLRISEIQELLETSGNLKKVIETRNGFHFLKGREDLVARRLNLYREAEERWRKLRKMATILQMVPNVLMIAACNTLPINDFKPESDIDAFIIVKKNRLWLTRFLVTVLVALFGQWRHKKRIAGKLCLSFYITDGALNLKPIAKNPYDIYLTYWITLVAPLYAKRHSEAEGSRSDGQPIRHAQDRRIPHPVCDFSSHSREIPPLRQAQGRDDIYQRFLQANYWVKDYLPNFVGFEPVENERKVKDVWILKVIKKIGQGIVDTKIGDWLENVLKKAQKNKMAKNYQSACRKDGSDVIISDQMLKFHEIDRREEFRERFETRLEEISNSLEVVRE